MILSEIYAKTSIYREKNPIVDNFTSYRNVNVYILYLIRVMKIAIHVFKNNLHIIQVFIASKLREYLTTAWWNTFLKEIAANKNLFINPCSIS